jgi:hypothetical protein
MLSLNHGSALRCALQLKWALQLHHDRPLTCVYKQEDGFPFPDSLWQCPTPDGTPYFNQAEQEKLKADINGKPFIPYHHDGGEAKA